MRRPEVPQVSAGKKRGAVAGEIRVNRPVIGDILGDEKRSVQEEVIIHPHIPGLSPGANGDGTLHRDIIGAGRHPLVVPREGIIPKSGATSQANGQAIDGRECPIEATSKSDRYKVAIQPKEVLHGHIRRTVLRHLPCRPGILGCENPNLSAGVKIVRLDGIDGETSHGNAWQTGKTHAGHGRPARAEVGRAIDVVARKAPVGGINPIGTPRLIDDEPSDVTGRGARAHLADLAPKGRRGGAIEREVDLPVVMSNDNEIGVVRRNGDGTDSDIRRRNQPIRHG